MGTMLGPYSKLVGTLVGGLFGIAMSKFGLPVEWATPDIQSAVTVLMSSVFTYFFPKNQPNA